MLFYVKEILNNSQDNCNHLKVLRDGKCNNWSLRLDVFLSADWEWILKMY